MLSARSPGPGMRRHVGPHRGDADLTREQSPPPRAQDAPLVGSDLHLDRSPPAAGRMAIPLGGLISPSAPSTAAQLPPARTSAARPRSTITAAQQPGRPSKAVLASAWRLPHQGWRPRKHIDTSRPRRAGNPRSCPPSRDDPSISRTRELMTTLTTGRGRTLYDFVAIAVVEQAQRRRFATSWCAAPPTYRPRGRMVTPTRYASASTARCSGPRQEGRRRQTAFTQAACWAIAPSPGTG